MVGSYNQRLHKYYSSPYLDVSDATIDKWFFNLGPLADLYYDRGYIIAAELDQIIDLDKYLKTKIQKCLKVEEYCQFDMAKICEEENCTSQQKIAINQIIPNVVDKKLNNKFFQSKLANKLIATKKVTPKLLEMIGDAEKVRSLNMDKNQQTIKIINNQGKQEIFKFKSLDNSVLMPFYQ